LGTNHQLVLRGGTVIDGTGAPARRADVAVDGGRIAAVTDPGAVRGETELDCGGLMVAPGFIDTHSHSDLRVLVEPQLPMKLLQGITLEVLGQDGVSVAPVRQEMVPEARRSLAGLLGDPREAGWRWETVADYLEALAKVRPALNLAYLVPHGTLRAYVMGNDDRAPTPEELKTMCTLLREGLDQGALGLSTGLIYPPCCYATTEELIALGQVLAGRRAPLVVHLRSESDRIAEAVDEMMSVGGRSGCPIHISHFKIAGKANTPLADRIIERLQRARGSGLIVTCDQYPYAAGSTMFGAILPPWVHAGGPRAALERLRDTASRRRIRVELDDRRPQDWDNFWKWTGPEGIVISDVPSGRRPDVLGKTVAAAAREAGKDPLDFALDLLIEEELGVGMVSHSQDEEVVERFMRLPYVNGCTDGLLGGRPHPRAYGSYPRFLGRYVRERKVLPLEEMVRKLTSQAAKAMRLPELGEVAAGFAADLVAFEPARVEDTATYEQPVAFPRGIAHVVVRGEVAVRQNEITGARAGTVVRAGGTP
jgi:N-acyl-D-amino-acid deacylase